MMSNYPPGHPTGVNFSAREVRCPKGHVWIQHWTHELDTNASYTESDEEICPECGQDPEEDDESEWEDHEPEPQFDTLEEARGER